MRSWIWYKTSGEVGGAERLIPGGWPMDLDFNNPQVQDPAVQNIRTMRLSTPGYAGFLPFDCECVGDICSCALGFANTHLVVGGTLVEKPSYAISVDGAVIAPGTQIDKTPGADISVSLSGAIMDGTVFDLAEPQGVSLSVLPTNPTALTFMNGVTNVVTIPAPPRLSIARLAIRPQNPRDGAVSGIRIRGW